MKIENVKIKDFKGLKKLSLKLGNVNLIIGGNNAGKSSVIQAIHFTISALKSTRIVGKTTNMPATTLGIGQFTYLPSHEIMSIRHTGNMTQDFGPSFSFTYADNDELRTFKLELRRGKNANVALTFDKNSKFYDAAANLIHPFSIYAPGLAGIPLIEERRANSIVQAGISQGDANLYLRNVLLRLSQDSAKMAAFHNLMRGIFPKIKTRTEFDENINQYINSHVFLDQRWIPLEMIGTGCLQALQLAAYVVLYEPKLLLLDEPDAHLHPGNQKLLVDLLFSLSATTGTQIILASHSRHVFNAIQGNENGVIHWLQNGELVDDDKADIPLLVELGALDAYEEIALKDPKMLVFCEDENTKKMQTLLESSEGNLEKIKIIPFSGVDNLESTLTVVEYFLSLSEDRRAIIYRDGDCMTPNEKQWLEERYQEKLGNRVLFLTSKMTDVEHYFCCPDHIAEIAKINGADAKSIVDQVVQENQAFLGSKLSKKRADLKFKALKTYAKSDTTDNLVRDGIVFEYSVGKCLMPKILDKLKQIDAAVESLIVASSHAGDIRIQKFLSA